MPDLSKHQVGLCGSSQEGKQGEGQEMKSKRQEKQYHVGHETTGRAWHFIMREMAAITKLTGSVPMFNSTFGFHF